MALADFPALKKLSARQKFALADELWLDALNAQTPVGYSHKNPLDARWRACKSGKTKTITRDELEHRLARK
jgi:putative addiction module component (TIGR02574 family)